MDNVIDPKGPEISIGDASLGVLAKAKQAMEAKKMGSAVEIQSPSQVIEQSRAVVTPMEMLDRALSNGASIETLTQLMDLQERWEKSQARKAFDAAIADAKAEISPIIRNAIGHNNKRYADFAAIARTVDPVITRHGLSYRFRTEQTDRIHVTCILSHKAGHSEETTLAGPPDASGNKNAIQAIGSTLTYLQRYSLTQALGLAAANDDDGRGAGGKTFDTVTPEQAKIIRGLLEETNSDIEQFCRMAKVDAVPDMLASDFDDAVRLLNAKKQKMAQRVAS